MVKITALNKEMERAAPCGGRSPRRRRDPAASAQQCMTVRLLPAAIHRSWLSSCLSANHFGGTRSPPAPSPVAPATRPKTVAPTALSALASDALKSSARWSPSRARSGIVTRVDGPWLSGHPPCRVVRRGELPQRLAHGPASVGRTVCGYVVSRRLPSRPAHRPGDLFLAFGEGRACRTSATGVLRGQRGHI